MKIHLIYLLVLLSCPMLLAQQRTVIDATDKISSISSSAENHYFFSLPTTKKESTLNTLAIRTLQKDLSFEIRMIGKKEETPQWEALPRNSHFQKGDDYWVSELLFLDNAAESIQLRLVEQKELNEKVELIFYQEFSNGTENPRYITPLQKVDCPCPQPAYLDRAAWCPLGDCTENANPVFTDVTHLIVHHAASTNASSNWSGVVRSIWDYHVNTNNWDDIGYNWLIDPNGVVYEGRGDDIRGAHFCGTNSNTLGICMLGDFQNEAPQATAINTLQDFLAWKSCAIDVDAEGMAFHQSSGLTLPRISGHRQGCATECPGDAFFPLFENMRQEVAEIRTMNCDVFLPPDNLEGLDINDEFIELSWNDNSSNEASFLVERSFQIGDDFIQIAELPTNTETYIDESANVPINSVFIYRVRAATATDTTNYSDTLLIAKVNTDELAITENEINIFPNPAEDQVTITSNNKLLQSVKLFTTNGRLCLFQKDIQGQEIDLNLTNINSGVYILKVITAEGNHIKKIKIN